MMRKRERAIALALAAIMVGEVVLPTAVFALTSGPSQPEVQGFTPVGASDMVNLFTGDMSYNIPLLDVEGYPINLAYSAGISTDQEASWVGLGWSLNPGVVERNLRGLPDDFNGDRMTREVSMRPNITVGAQVGFRFELFGVDGVTGKADTSLTPVFTVSPSYNNYNGVEFSIGADMGLQSAKKGKSRFNFGLGVNSSSHEGLSVQPSLGIDRELGSNDDYNTTGSLNIGLGMNSRQGIQNVSFGTSVKMAKEWKDASGKLTKARKDRINGPGSSYSLGRPAYTPQISIPMNSTSFSLRVSLGAAMAGFHPGTFIGGSYSRQSVRNPSTTTPAFGYFNLAGASSVPDALIDMNRENDGPYRASDRTLPIASLTNDVFSASGQNMGGSYRAYRDEVGHVRDAATTSGGVGGSGGVEFGFGGVSAHIGVDLTVNSSVTRTGDWTHDNVASQRLRYKTSNANALDEHVYFREASEPVLEQDDALYGAFGGDLPLAFSMDKRGAYDVTLGTRLKNGPISVYTPTQNEKTKRDPRGQLFSYLSHKELAAGLGLVFPIERTGSPLTGGGAAIPGHHMSEVTIVGMDGSRNIYGIPAYNLTQHDVTFAIGSSTPHDETEVLVDYDHGTDNTTGNNKGKDRFYSRSITPSYAYAFLLTAVLSNDYSDVDEIKGPSAGDLGNYTRFAYELVDPSYPWRTPAGEHKARLDRGSAAVNYDDKASYVYGRKELWYLDTIETRNMIAVFHHSAREDGRGVDEDGAIAANTQDRLDSIRLYERRTLREWEANGALGPLPIAIKVVHFEYDESYPLCPGTPNSAAASKGKLTLRKVYFTYGRSARGVTSPYVFNYEGPNPAYDPGANDRWGSYKPEGLDGLPNHSYPYADQDRSTADPNASAWALTSIRLPSGGTIEVVYEADDYAYVQNKRAHRMYKVAGIDAVPVEPGDVPASFAASYDLRNENKLLKVYFELPEGFVPPPADPEITPRIADFLPEVDGVLYYRFKTRMDFNGGSIYDDYVSGYARIQHIGDFHQVGGTWYGWVLLEPEDIDMDCTFAACAQVSPMTRAALELARREYPNELFQPSGLGEDSDPVIQTVLSVASSIGGLFTGLINMLRGPNGEARTKTGPAFGTVKMGDSWIRLADPTGHKLGGGHRVRRVHIQDAWDEMVTGGISVTPRTYGQEYGYTLDDSPLSSGVAAWEPNMGADENVWRRPYFGSVNAPPNKGESFYQETPFGESLFPSASVGYSRVTVRDIYPEGGLPEQQGTGTVVSEFYTAKDFPTITGLTDLQMIPGRSSFSVMSLLKLRMIDNMHTSQGFTVETNDMHGKPKRTSVFPQASGSTAPTAISTIDYQYRSMPYGNNSRLTNEALTISPDGTVQEATIGRHYEFLADMRNYSTKAFSGGMQLNTETMFIAIIPILLGNIKSEQTAYRSATMVKKIHRFGMLEKVVKMENGSTVSTENVAYDSETGSVLLTRSSNEFEDPVYTMRFPAYWHYDGMGPAYRNHGAILRRQVDGGLVAIQNAASIFAVGDELALWPTSGPPMRAWVQEVTPGSVALMDRYSYAIPNGEYLIKVLRSGRRNMQDVDMASMTLLTDPLQGISSNVFQNILTTQVVEFGTEWRSECACLVDPVPVNCFVANRCGVWRLSKEHVWLTERTRSMLNNNTDIRKDGVYASYEPFYKLANGQWEKDAAGWTMVRAVTQYSSRGQELENQDALGLYSSATFAHGGSVPNSVARNARYSETAFESFEEGEDPMCLDRRFQFDELGDGIVMGKAHSGRYSLRVSSTPARINVELRSQCESKPCGVSIEDAMDGQLVYYEISGGTPPYSISTEILTGEPIVELHGEHGLVISGSGEVSIIVQDGSGCWAQREVHSAAQ